MKKIIEICEFKVSADLGDVFPLKAIEVIMLLYKFNQSRTNLRCTSVLGWNYTEDLTIGLHLSQLDDHGAPFYQHQIVIQRRRRLTGGKKVYKPMNSLVSSVVLLLSSHTLLY